LPAILSCLAIATNLAAGQEKHEPPAGPVLFKNARIFDGKSERLAEGMNLLVVGNKISKVAKEPIAAPEGATVIDAGGKVLMPGMIDAHTHPTLCLTADEMQKADDFYIALKAADEANKMLYRGFTTIRDTAGPSFGLKRAIDEGIIDGPRIYPCGAAISQTAGHGDFRNRPDKPRRWGGRLNRFEQLGLMTLADGRDEVLAATREQLRLGATQIKVMAGGGVVSEFDPLDVSQYLEDELKVAVDAAADWGTYVTVHAYNPTSIARAVKAGVKCIEHGHLIDEPTMKLLADKGIFLSTQVVLFTLPIDGLDDARRAKAKQVVDGTSIMFRLARKYNVKVCFGTDLVFSSKIMAFQSKELTARLEWFSPVEVLRQATSINGELLALSGRRNPYGKLGVVEAGAMADLLLVNGNPLEDLKLLTDPEKNLLVVMKDGRLCKKTLP
jgi:imidazolonepropionase-like amidohydrolase